MLPLAFRTHEPLVNFRRAELHTSCPEANRLVDLSQLMKDWHGDSTKHLHLEINRGHEYSKSALRREISSRELTRKLHQISLGLKVLDLERNVGISIEIFGPDILKGNRAAAEWPLLESFHFDYDQCIIDALDVPRAAVLSRMAWSPSEASRLWPIQERVWEAAAVAAQRMPKLKSMRMRSRSTNSPRLEVRIDDDSVHVVLTWHDDWRDTTDYAPNGDGRWRPTDKFLDAWRNYAAMHGRSFKTELLIQGWNAVRKQAALRGMISGI